MLGILRRFEVANEDNIPKNIESLKIDTLSDHTTTASFVFHRIKYHVLIDNTAEDDATYIIGQIRTVYPNVIGELLENPTDSVMEYGISFKGRDAYLFIEKKDKKRLDIELATRYPDVSRNTWQKYIKEGRIKVNDKVLTVPKFEVSETDSIAVDMPQRPNYSDKDLPIIYLDDNVIVINKPAGVLSHAKGELNEEFTVADFFSRYTSYNIDTNRPGIIHRLDRDTTGVMIGARNPETAVLLQKQFADRKTKKTYYAIINGHPKLDSANIDLPIERNLSAPSTFRVGSNGKSAITRYDVVSRNEDYSLVKLQPKTGRTHQIRVHMKYLNTPILGDRVYGDVSDRMYLHAYSLEITIPNGQRVTFEAPLPDDFRKHFPEIEL